MFLGIDIHVPKIKTLQINVLIPKEDIHGKLPSLWNTDININESSLEIHGPKIDVEITIKKSKLDIPDIR